MIKNDIFKEGKANDLIIYTNTDLKGEILEIKDNSFTVKWLHSTNSQNKENVPAYEYYRIEDWRKVFIYENEKDLLHLRLKYEKYP